MTLGTGIMAGILLTEREYCRRDWARGRKLEIRIFLALTLFLILQLKRFLLQ